MSSRKTAGRRGTTKKRAQRATSNVFAMFNQDQIQEFKEAFNMIDHVSLVLLEPMTEMIFMSKFCWNQKVVCNMYCFYSKF